MAGGVVLANVCLDFNNHGIEWMALLFIGRMSSRFRGAGTLTSYPAMYLWNQPAADGNHTPSWDDFVIPPIIVD